MAVNKVSQMTSSNMFYFGSGGASILGTLIAVVVLIRDPNNPLWFGVILGLSMGTGVIVFLVGLNDRNQKISDHENTIQNLTVNGNRKLAKKESEIQRILDKADEGMWKLFGDIGYSSHMISHELRDEITRLLYHTDNIAPDELKRQSQHVVRSICDHVSRIFSGYLDREVTTTVKMIETVNNKEQVYTLERGGKKDSGRRSKAKYSLGPENTAFFLIRHGEVRWFFGSDLIAMHQEGTYHNQNPLWDKQYKSAAVVPIRRDNPEDNPEEQFLLLGFLCIDANEKGALDDDHKNEMAEMLMAIADILYVYLKVVDTLDKQNRPK